MGWYNYHLTCPFRMRLSSRLRTAGLGFKSSSRAFSQKGHGRRAKRLLVILAYASCKNVALSLAIALGYVLPPSVIGELRRRLIESLNVRPPELPPDDGFAYPGMKDFLEYSLFHGWMKQYLSYLKWRCMLELDPWITLDEILDVPEYILFWYCPDSDIQSFKFGITFRLDDWCIDALRHPIRELTPLRRSMYVEGYDFLMFITSLDDVDSSSTSEVKTIRHLLS